MSMSSSSQNQHCVSSSGADSQPKSPRKTSIFLFGSTGFLGQEILSVLCSKHQPQEHYNLRFIVSALIRPETLESTEERKVSAMNKLKAAGVQLISGDVEKATVDQLAKWMSGHDIVLSAIAYSGSGPLPDLKILEAVQQAKVKWFIPSAVSVDITTALVDTVPGLAARKQLLQLIRKSSVNYIFFCTGLMTEYLLSPFNGVDSVHGTVTAPYSYDARISTTTTKDVAHLIVEALVRREEVSVKNEVLKFAGDTVSYWDIHSALEKKTKRPWKKNLVSKEEAIEAVKSDVNMKNVVGRFRVIFGEQKGVWWEVSDSWNSKHAQHIHMTTLAEYIQTME